MGQVMNYQNKESNILSGLADHVETLLVSEMSLRVNNALAKMDLGTEISRRIGEYIEKRMKYADLPTNFINHQTINFDGFKISADHISKGTIKKFTSSGIQDAAENIELTIVDQAVVIENNLVARKVEIQETLYANNATVETLNIRSQILFGEPVNKQITSIIRDQVTNEISSRKIDIVNSAIYNNGKEILTENTLGPSIVYSNLRKLGRLNELSVSGISQFNDTLLITDSGKVGINTQDPEGALTVWDDDSELTIRRYKKKTTYIGTMRDCDLVLGTKGEPKLEIKQDGTVRFHSLDLNGLKISVEDQIPSRPGTQGEIVFIKNSNANEPWGYRCLGGNVWQAMTQ